MYFPHAFRKSFLPSSQAAIASLATATLGTTTGYVITVALGTNIAVGHSVVAAGIATGTTVSVVSGTTVTLSQPIIAAIPTGTSVVFGNGVATTTITPALNAPNVLQFGTTAASTAGIVPGMTVTVSGVPAGTVVTSVSGGFVTLSASVTATVATGTNVAFGASGVSVLTAGSTASLAAGQIGFFSPDGVAVQSASAKPFMIAQGSYFLNDKISPALGGYKESVKTKMINPKYISRVVKIVAKSPRQMVVNVPIVNNGLACDTTYRLRIDVKGSPALRFLSHNMYRTLDSYTGCCSTVDPTLLKDPVPTLLNWADQINLSPIFNTMVSARVYKLAVKNTTTAADATSASTTSAVFAAGAATSIALGQKVVGTSIPANSFITNLSGTTVTITYPLQQTAPAVSVFNNKEIKYYTDVYSGATGTVQPNAVVYIPGTTIESGVGGSATTTGSVSTGAVAGAAYSGSADAASFVVDAHIELTGAYQETKFGLCTFTPTDKYDLEPLTMITSVVDESGDPCAASVFTSTNSPSVTTGLATDGQGVIQTPIQASGSGETVLRDMILSDRYLQLAYPDSSRVESLRMREIESNPGLANISRIGLYDQVMVLHSVPRFNNPSGMFDNDQYLLVFNVPTGTSTTGLTNYLVSAVSAAGGSIPSNTAGGFEQY